jgi:hypothetical protein
MTAILGISASVDAAIWYVDGTKATNGIGNSWPNAFNNLQSALNNTALAGGDQIWVRGNATGITYKPGTTRSSSFVLKDKVRVFGGFAGTEGSTQIALRDPVANVTILSGDIGVIGNAGDNCYHVVKAIGRLDYPDTVLDGFTIRGGNANDARGVETRGGGIYIESTSPGDTNACRPLIVRCVLVDNDASDDGGAAAVVGAIIASDDYLCEPWFINCSFLGNGAADDGSAMAAVTGDPTIMNCVFSGNSAGDRGGAIASLPQSSVRIVNSTLSSNSASTTGGAASVSGGFGGAGLIDAVNTIVWGNTGGSPTETAQVTSGVAVNYSCIQGLTVTLGGVGNIGSNPSFIDANGADNVTGTVDDDLRLQPGSPCNDVGDNPSIFADAGDLDYDNNPTEPTPFDIGAARRVALDALAGVLGPCDGLRVDMGAHENGDCDGDGVPDRQETDANGDGIPDACQDCNGDNVLDPAQIEGNDCNANDRLDECDIALGCSPDANGNGVPDECECGLEILFVVDVSGSIAGQGAEDGEIEPICQMIAAIESALPTSPLVINTRMAVFSNAVVACISQDIRDVIGLSDEPSDLTPCGEPIGPEDWVSAVELLSISYPWRPGSRRVIVPISDEGGCLDDPCAATSPPLLAAIAAATSNAVTVYPVIGIESGETCSATAGAALASGTGGLTWSASAIADYNAVGGIGDQLAEELLAWLSACLELCPADLDGDGQVAASDLTILLAAWGPCAGACPADLNGDGNVNAADLTILLAAWGPCENGFQNQMMASAASEGGGSDGSASGLTPLQLANAMGFATVEEFGAYLASLDFEAMQTLLESYFGP